MNIETETRAETEQPKDDVEMTEPNAMDEEAIREEVRKYMELKKRYKQTRYPEVGTEAFLINLEWVRRWKQYVGYKDIKKGRKPNYMDNHKENYFPGPITNEKLLREHDSYYQDDEVENICNNVLKHGMRERVDYKIWDAGTWNYLQEIYGGRTIKRYHQQLYSIHTQVEVYLKEVPLFILPPYEQLEIDSLSTTTKSVFASKYQNIKDLKERVLSVLNCSKHDMKLSMDRFRLWKLEYSTDLKGFINILRERGISKSSDIKQSVDAEEEEENLGMDFPGECLEHLKTLKLENAEIGTTDVVIVETASPATKQFLFKFKPNLVVHYGKCEYCYGHKALKVECRCKKVRYCSEDCRRKDERFHLDKCPAAIEVEQEFDITKRAGARMGLCGLQNLLINENCLFTLETRAL